MLEAPFTFKAPKRLPALLWSIILILLPTPALFSEVWWAWLMATPCFVMAGILWLSILSPGRFLHGVRRFPEGFEVRRPLRRAAFVEFNAIIQIEAVVMRDGDMGLAFVDLVVRTRREAVRISEEKLRESGLLAELQSLPKFNAEAFVQALQYEPSGITEIFAKHFKVLDAA